MGEAEQQHAKPGRLDPKIENRLDTILRRMRASGKRVTPQRMAILRVLAGSEGHPSVEQVHAAIRPEFPTTSLATVYKTIRMLGELGEIMELEFSGLGNRYDGARPYPHPHVICRTCGAIRDSDDREWRELARKIARETGYAISGHRLDFFGLCPRCQG